MLLVLAVGLAACTSDSDSDDTSDTDNGTDTDDGQTAPVAAGEAIPTIRYLGPSTTYDNDQFEAGNIVIEALEELGFTVELLTAPDFSTYADLVLREDWDITASGYVGQLARLEPSALLTAPYLCQHVGGSNYSGYCNEDYDALIERSQAELDPDARRELIHEAQAQLLWDLPTVTYYHPTLPSIYNNTMYDTTVVNPVSGYYDFWNFISATPIDDDTVRIGDADEGRSLNPLGNASYFHEQELQLLFFDTLTRIDPDGDVVPWAADEVTAVDDVTIEVELRSGMTFHDGEPVTAADVAFTYEFFDEWEVGRYAAGLGRVATVEPDGDTTVRFNLEGPYAAIQFELFSQLPILPAHIWDGVVEAEGLGHPSDWADPELTGSGPYQLVSYDPVGETRMTRFDDHFDPPVAENLLVSRYANPESLFLALRAGDIGFTDGGPGFTVLQVEEAEADADLTVTSAPSITVRWAAFNTAEGPFSDFEVRRAVVHAIDSETIISDVLRGHAEPGRGVIAPANTAWHNDGIPPGPSDEPLAWPQFDLDLARQILEDAGYTWDEQGRLHYPDPHEPSTLNPEPLPWP